MNQTHDNQTNDNEPGLDTLVRRRFAVPDSAIGCPVDHLLLVASKRGLRALLWPNDLDNSRIKARVRLDDAVEGSNGILDQTVGELDEYFGGERRSFSLPLDPLGTEFQRAVWFGLARIPYAETTSYGKQAAELGRPSAVRAVAAANGRNPISIVLPCHRIIGADGSLTGFAAGLEVKAWLLNHESGHAASAGTKFSKNAS